MQNEPQFILYECKYYILAFKWFYAGFCLRLIRCCHYILGFIVQAKLIKVITVNPLIYLVTTQHTE